MIVAAEQALVPAAPRGPWTVELDGPEITEVRPWRAGDPKPRTGLLIPGLVNAHTHLELGWTRGLLPRGTGFADWGAALLRLPRPDAEAGRAAIDAGISELVASGTVAVSDICNGPPTTRALDQAGLGGVVQRETLGLTPGRQASLLAAAALPPRRKGRVTERTSPHALYSMHRPLLEATVRASGLGAPASLHVAEDLAHLQFLRDATGPLAESLASVGVDFSTWEPPGRGPIAHLDALGLLGPDLMLVHGVHLSAEDLSLIGRSGSPVVLCVRSNLWIGGRTPDVHAMLAAGLPLALGTDSLASNDDLDLLQEVRALAELDLPVRVGLSLATAGGAHALRLPWAGRLQAGRAPGLLLVHPERPWDGREILVRGGMDV